MGDINGDGYDDILIGAADAERPNAGGDQVSAGESYVVFGKSQAFTAEALLSALQSIEGGDGTAGFVLEGTNTFDLAGGSISGAGDLNADGFADLIIGSQFADPDGDASGQSYVIFGTDSGFGISVNLSELNGANGFIINGIDLQDLAGKVSSAGDINSDGFADIVIGANGRNSGAIRPGAVYVLFGNNIGFSATVDLESLDGTNGFVITGIADADGVGSGVGEAGDFNGDGLHDLVIGAPGVDPNGQSKAGAAYVIFGRESGFNASLDLSSLDGTNGFVINGVAANDRLGESVGGAGDINGDGLADLVIGASRSDVSGTDSGAAYVVFGKVSGYGTVLELSTLNGTNGFQIQGVSAGDQVGYSVSGAGDVNGDGYSDVVIGAPTADPQGVSTGATYVVFGNAGTFVSTLALSSLNGLNGVVIRGIGSSDWSGSAVSNSGDMNGDGYDDVLIGAMLANRNGKTAVGENYLVFGGNITSAVTHSGDANDNALAGTSSANVMNGAQGNDTLAGGGGADVLHGGAGDDVLAVSDTNFAQVQGDNGSDTLRLDGAGMTLDLTAMSETRLSGIERIDLRGSGANTLTLDRRSLLRLSDNSNTLIVLRDADDTVDFGTGWTSQGVQSIGGSQYGVFTQGAATLLLSNTADELTLPSGGGTFELTRDGDDLILRRQAGEELFRKNIADVIGLTIDGSTDADRLIVDYSNGNPVPTVGLVFNGAEASDSETGDTLELIGGTATLVTHSFVSAATVIVDGAVISHSGLESIEDQLSAAQRTFVFGDSADVVTVGDNAAAGSGMSRLISSSASAAVDFPNPSGLLTINTGDGNDAVNASGLSAKVLINGQLGDDTLTGGSNNDTLYGGVGRDVLNGGNGNDVLAGQAGHDTLNGGDGHDLLRAGAGNDWLNGQGGKDTLFGEEGWDTLFGGANPDWLDGGAGNDRLNGQAGNDMLIGGDDNGNDTLQGGADNDTLLGGAGSDKLDGEAGNDQLDGGADNDQLIGSDGNDLLAGGTGNDSILGGTGRDTLLGDAGNDTLLGGSNNDVLLGDDGDDSLDGGLGTDTLAGNNGNDVIVGLVSEIDEGFTL